MFSSTKTWSAGVACAMIMTASAFQVQNVNLNLHSRVVAASRGEFMTQMYASSSAEKEEDDTPMSRREAVQNTVATAAAVALAATTTAPVVANAEEGRLVEFTVENLDGEVGKSGKVVIQLRPDWAPKGAARFEELTEKKFWDGCRIFRVLPGFVSQFGINGDTATQGYWRSKSLQDDPVKVSNTRGTVVYATSGANTRTTQIFVNTGDRNSFLDKQGFSPFGEVIEGMDIVDRFYSGYGEGAPSGKGPNQGTIQMRGNDYLEDKFPQLSYFSKAVLK